MESHAKYFFVGLSLIVLTAFGVAALLWLNRAGRSDGADSYLVRFRHHSLSGLGIGSVVTMRGIRVGSVMSFRFSPQDMEQVEVFIQVQRDTPVKTDTRAVVSTNLLTGVSSIDLLGGTQGAPFLSAVAGEYPPAITEGQTNLQAIRESFPELMDQSSETIRRLSDILSDKNRENVETILADLRLMTDRLAHGGDDPAAVLRDIRLLTEDLRQTVKELRRSTGEANRHLAGVAETLRREVEVMSRRVSQAAAAVTALADNWRNPREIISGPASSSLGPGEEVRR